MNSDTSSRMMDDDQLRRDRLTAAVAHDLKAPLITIQGYVSSLESVAQSGDWTGFRADVQRISRACDRMRRLLEDLVELTRKGTLLLTPREASLNDVVSAALEQLGGILRGQEIAVEVDENLPSVMADPRRLLQVIQNLIENAVKSVQGKAGARVGVRAHRHENGDVEIVVSDNGAGLEACDLDRVFEPYWQLNPNRSGVGLGLAIARMVVDAHGGRIWMESAGTGKGAAVHVLLPREPQGRHAG